VPILQIGQFDAKVSFSCTSWYVRELQTRYREVVLTEGSGAEDSSIC
jgi:hypothetical protein